MDRRSVSTSPLIVIIVVAINIFLLINCVHRGEIGTAYCIQ